MDLSLILSVSMFGAIWRP